MNKIYTRKVEVDFDGNYLIEIPEEIVEYLQLGVDDIVVWEVVEDKITIRKRRDI